MGIFLNLFLVAIVLLALPGLAVVCIKAGLHGEPLGYLFGFMFAACVIVGIVRIPQQFQIAKIVFGIPGAAIGYCTARFVSGR